MFFASFPDRHSIQSTLIWCSFDSIVAILEMTQKKTVDNKTPSNKIDPFKQKDSPIFYSFSFKSWALLQKQQPIFAHFWLIWYQFSHYYYYFNILLLQKCIQTAPKVQSSLCYSFCTCLVGINGEKCIKLQKMNKATHSFNTNNEMSSVWYESDQTWFEWFWKGFFFIL